MVESHLNQKGIHCCLGLMIESNYYETNAIGSILVSFFFFFNFNQIDSVVRNIASIHGFHLVNTRVVCKVKF